MPGDAAEPAPVWVPIEAVIDLHEELLEAHGGAPGLRDRGALARPRQIQAYQPEADLLALAAAYARGIIQRHPFVDGNKRAAFVTLGVFLTLNGLYLDATEGEAEGVIMGLAAGAVSEAQLAAWLRETCAPLAPPA